MVQNTPYIYEVKDCLKLLFVSYFYVEEVFPRAQAFQNATLGNSSVFQHPGDRLLPLSFNDWDYHDYRYFEWYMCQHLEVKYIETMYWWPIGFPSWVEKKEITFECTVMNFANDLIRVQFFIPYTFSD